MAALGPSFVDFDIVASMVRFELILAVDHQSTTGPGELVRVFIHLKKNGTTVSVVNFLIKLPKNLRIVGKN